MLELLFPKLRVKKLRHRNLGKGVQWSRQIFTSSSDNSSADNSLHHIQLSLYPRTKNLNEYQINNDFGKCTQCYYLQSKEPEIYAYFTVLFRGF